MPTAFIETILSVFERPEQLTQLFSMNLSDVAILIFPGVGVNSSITHKAFSSLDEIV